MFIKYYSMGSMSLKEGLTLGYNTYADDGHLIAGVENLEQRFMYEEITEEEFLKYKEMLSDPNVPKGMAGGILNEEGVEKYRKHQQSINQKIKEKQEKRISLVVKKIKKQLELGIIDEEDVDEEIKINDAVDFADEIKKGIQEG